MSRYYRFIIENKEPLRIADDSSSQRGQQKTLSYIPGSTLRGMAMNYFAQKGKVPDCFFSEKLRFLNAYPVVKNGEEYCELIPSPKGFYEDKTEAKAGEAKKIQNVVINGDFEEGMKRAGLGQFCRIEGGVCYFYNVEKGSDLKIKLGLDGKEEQNVFRNEYIRPKNHFAGYVAVDEPDAEKLLEEVFSSDMILGNGRTAGLGKCRVLQKEVIEKLPFDVYKADEAQ